VDARKRWRAFPENHREAIVAFDFFTVPTLTFKVLYCFFVIEHGRRKILHFNVTRHPSADWVSSNCAKPSQTRVHIVIAIKGETRERPLIAEQSAFHSAVSAHPISAQPFYLKMWRADSAYSSNTSDVTSIALSHVLLSPLRGRTPMKRMKLAPVVLGPFAAVLVSLVAARPAIMAPKLAAHAAVAFDISPPLDAMEQFIPSMRRPVVVKRKRFSTPI
jgi:hypothetical protein